MKQFIRIFFYLLTFSVVLFTSGCGSNGSASGSVHISTGIYGGYGYPYSNYGYYDRSPVYYPGRPGRPDRPSRPDRRPSIQPVHRPSGGMGRPSGMSRGGGRRR